MTSPARRDGGLDALRAATTLLVLFHHAALTYGAIGGWYYREVRPDGSIGTKLLILFCTVNQAWFMGLFFFIAGYLTPGAVVRHGAHRYLRDRVLRLGCPLLIYGFLIGPATIALAQTARGRPFGVTLLGVWEHGMFENGPLWFAQALLSFTLVYIVWNSLTRNGRGAAVWDFPTHRRLVVAVLATGIAAFALRLIWPVGVTEYGLQLGYFASYVVLFFAGCAGARERWVETMPTQTRRVWLLLAWAALPVLPAMVLLAPNFPWLRGDVAGGWNIQAVIYAFWEPLVAWGFIMGLLHWFSRRFARLGPLWSTLSRRAFAIYIVHPPVLVAIALAWRGVPAPHLVKFALTGTAACLACFAIAGLVLRVPWVRRVV